MRARAPSVVFWVAVWLVLGFIMLPAFVVAVAAFGASSIMTFPPRAWSLRWFERALSYDDFRAGLVNGLIVTSWASTLAVAAGAAFAIAAHRYRFRGRDALLAVLLSPMVIPHFTIGLGLLILAARTGLLQSFTLVVACHVILVLPFVLRSVAISLASLDRRLEQAAAGMGAGPWTILLRVTLPLLAPGLFSGWLFAAILSFNEFTASLFVTSQATQTLPVAMYAYVREFADPTLAAVSVIYIVVTATLLTLANRFLGLERVLRAGHG
jgi:putative spermidine/putrescine transport system permease protein